MRDASSCAFVYHHVWRLRTKGAAVYRRQQGLRSFAVEGCPGKNQDGTLTVATCPAAVTTRRSNEQQFLKQQVRRAMMDLRSTGLADLPPVSVENEEVVLDPKWTAKAAIGVSLYKPVFKSKQAPSEPGPSCMTVPDRLDKLLTPEAAGEPAKLESARRSLPRTYSALVDNEDLKAFDVDGGASGNDLPPSPTASSISRQRAGHVPPLSQSLASLSRTTSSASRAADGSRSIRSSWPLPEGGGESRALTRLMPLTYEAGPSGEQPPPQPPSSLTPSTAPARRSVDSTPL